MIGLNHPFSIHVGPTPYLPLLTFVSYSYTFTTLGYSPNNNNNDYNDSSSNSDASSYSIQAEEDAIIQYFTEREISRWDILQYEHESFSTITTTTTNVAVEYYETGNIQHQQTKTSTIPQNDNDTNEDVFVDETTFSNTNTDDDNTMDCPIEDDDCIAFSSLITTLSSSSNDNFDTATTLNSAQNEGVIDQTCPIEDIDCYSFLPEIHELYVNVDNANRISNELTARSNTITTSRIENNWRTAHCVTRFVLLPQTNRVRMIHVDSNYPMIAVCGTSHGDVYVMNLDTETVLAHAEGAHRPGRGYVTTTDTNDDTSGPDDGATVRAIKKLYGDTINSDSTSRAMNLLYGSLDGGGVISVAMYGNLVVSSGREGGAKLWKYDRTNTLQEEQLDLVCTLPNIDGVIVPKLAFDNSSGVLLLWVGCFDGTVRAYDVQPNYNEDPIDDIRYQTPPTEMKYISDFTDSVLDMHLCNELQLGVVATADGSAALFDMSDGQFFVGILLFQNIAARSVCIVRRKLDMGYVLLCGGVDGTIHMVQLNVNLITNRVDKEKSFVIEDTITSPQSSLSSADSSSTTMIRPKHVGPVMCLTSPGDGRFISGGQDGTLRVWDLIETATTTNEKTTNNDYVGNGVSAHQVEAKCNYALTGYKLWLGSVWSDGKRLISDGGEQSIVIRDFSLPP
jgi:WD40 repeat protein